MNETRRRVTVALVATIAVLVIAAIVVLMIQQGNAPRTAAVERGDLAATIETTGRLSAHDPTTVRSPADGRVSLVAVMLGDTVQEGDIIAVLDDQPFERAVTSAERAVESAGAALSVAENRVAADPSPQAQADLLSARNALTAAQEQLDEARRQLADTQITTPVDGTIIELQVAEGAPVANLATVATVARLDDMELNVDLDETDVPRVSAGTPVRFRLDAYPDREMTGTITQIAPAARSDGGVTSFPVTVAVSLPEDLEARPGMNATVSIDTAVRQGVLLVPEAAVRTVGERTFVTVVHDSREEEREIRTGLRANGMVEVASGLSEGDRVVVP
mgnify:FL=1